jgi:hypothetical protein
MATEVITAEVEITSHLSCEAYDDVASNEMNIVCEFVCSSATAAPLDDSSTDIGLFPLPSTNGIPTGQHFIGLTIAPATHPPRLFL